MPAYSMLGYANFWTGHAEKTIEIADRAIRLSPRDPQLYSFYWAKGVAYGQLNENAQAIDLMRRVVAMAPEFSNAQRGPAELALNGQEAEARQMIQHYLSLKEQQIRTIAQFRAFVRTRSDNPAYLAGTDRVVEGLRKAGMPEE